MNIVTNKAFIDGVLYDVVPIEQLCTVPYQLINERLAVTFQGYILPIRFTNALSKVGLYYGCFCRIVLPSTPEEEQMYSISNLAYSSDHATFADIIAAREKLESAELKHLVSSDNIYVPVIDPINDSPLSIALKTSIGEKHCNINRYSSRFGDDFNNDRRKLSGNDITAAKYATFGRNMDVRTTLIIEDMNPDVANPIGKRIILTWVGDGVNDQAYEELYKSKLSGVTPNIGGDQDYEEE